MGTTHLARDIARQVGVPGLDIDKLLLAIQLCDFTPVHLMLGQDVCGLLVRAHRIGHGVHPALRVARGDVDGFHPGLG